MTYRLYDFPASPFCLKIRAILDYKGIAFDRIDVTGRRLLELRRRGRIGKVPALDLDGVLICDSTDIAYELERRHPEPAIVPADRRNQALCHVLEDWADESFYWLGVYYRWQDPAGRAGAGAIFPPGLRRLLSGLVARRAVSQLCGQGLGRKPPAQVASDLDRQLRHAASLLEDRHFLLGTTSPMLCDFALCGQLIYLARTPLGAPAIARTAPVSAFLDRMKALREQWQARAAKPG